MRWQFDIKFKFTPVSLFLDIFSAREYNCRNIKQLLSADIIWTPYWKSDKLRQQKSAWYKLSQCISESASWFWEVFLPVFSVIFSESAKKYSCWCHNWITHSLYFMKRTRNLTSWGVMRLLLIEWWLFNWI